MKQFRYVYIALILLIMLPCAVFASADDKAVLALPQGLTIIEEGAFNGTACERAVLPDGVLEIHAGAFTNASLSAVNLPSSLTFIAEDAFDGPEKVTVSVEKGCYAYDWAARNGYLIPFTWAEREDGTLTITSYEGTDTQVTVPETIDGKTVTAIGSSAFYQHEALECVVLPETVTTILNSAFERCEKLTEINLPGTLKNIGAQAFFGCTSLKRLELPDNLESVGVYAFGSDYTTVRSMLLVCDRNSKTAKTISAYSFTSPGEEDYIYVWLNDKLTLVKYVGEAVDLILPDWIDSLYNECFSYCQTIESVTLTDKITVISKSAFYGCNALKRVVLPETVTTIMDNAFGRCGKLTEINLPGSLKNIGVQAFAGCTSLTRLELPDDLESIGYCAFGSEYTTVRSMLLVCDRNSKTAKTISSYSFTSPGEEDYIYVWLDNKLTLVKYLGEAMYLTLPDWIDALYHNCFYYKEELVAVDLPESISGIPSEAFYHCTSLKYLILPDTVTFIGHSAFNRCTGLETIVFPYGVSSIGSNVMDHCPATAYVYEGSYSHEWCELNNVSYSLIGVMSADLNVGSDGTGWVNHAISLSASAEGGVPPYSYRFSGYKNGELLYSTDWQRGPYSSFMPVEEAAYSFSVEVMDLRGMIVSADCSYGGVRVPTEEELIEVERMEFYRRMKAALNAAKSPTQCVGAAYYNSLPDEWEWYQQWMSILTLDLANVDTYVAEREYLVYSSIKVAAAGKSCMLFNGADLPAVLDVISDYAGLDKLQAFEEWKKWINSELIEMVTDNELYNVYEGYTSGRLSDIDASELLKSFHFSDRQASAVIHKMDFMKRMDKVAKAIKVLKNVKIVVDDSVEAINLISLMDCMDMEQLRILARSYVISSSGARRDAGNILLEFCNASEDERIGMILAGKGTRLGLDLILNNIDVASFAGAAGKIYSITVGVLDVLTGVRTLPQKYHALNYATEMVQHCWNQFRIKRSNFIANPCDDNYESAYFAIINYYESSALAEDEFVALVEASKYTVQNIGEPLAEAAGRAEANAAKLRSMASSLRAIYDIWQERDYLTLMDQVEPLFEDYNGY